MKTIARVLLLVFGGLIALIGIGLLIAGGTLGWALATHRDKEGFFTTPHGSFHTTGYAVTSQVIDLGHPSPMGRWSEQHLVTIRVKAKADNDAPIFVGVGPAKAIDEYLA